MVLAVAQDIDVHGLIDRGNSNNTLEHGAVLHCFAVHGSDDIAGFHACLGRRRVIVNLGYDHAPGFWYTESLGGLRIDFADVSAEVTSFNRAFGLEHRNNSLDEVAGDGQADALESAALAFDGGAHSNDLAFEIDERAARVARIDGGIGLQIILVHAHVEPVASLGADDAVRDGA